jgi:acyl-CoA thioester hydrolase
VNPALSELPPFQAAVQPEWIDYNGHMRDAYYGLVLSYAMDDMMDRVGLDAPYRERTQCTLYTIEVHVHYLREVKITDSLVIHTAILDADRKRVHVGCRFTCARLTAATPVATAEAMMVHVHQGAEPMSAPFPPDIAERLQALRQDDTARAAAHAAFGPSSRKIELKRR